jgi:hypothetical protein
MTWKRRFLGIGASALILLGISTNASATITGTGCVLSGAAAQSAPPSVAAFTSWCAGTTTGITNVVSGNLTYSFTLPDVLSLNDNSATVTGAGMIANAGGVLTTPNAASAFSPASSGSASTGLGNSTVWDLHETNIVPGTYTVTLTHDDGIVLLESGVAAPLINAAAPTSAAVNSATFTVAAGQTLDLLYDECCGFPATLEGTMPPESAAIPEPSSLVLLGSTLLGIGTLLRRRRQV